MPTCSEKGTEVHLDYAWAVSMSGSLARMIPVMLWPHESMQVDKFPELYSPVRSCNCPKRVNRSPVRTSLVKKTNRSHLGVRVGGIWFAWLKCMDMSCKKRKVAYPASHDDIRLVFSKQQSGKMHCRAAWWIRKHIFHFCPCAMGLGTTMPGIARSSVGTCALFCPLLIK